MTHDAASVARGRCDAGARLIAADGPIAGLQRACGGDIPGLIAVPALLELVRKACHHRLPFAQRIGAQSASSAISAWAEIVPEHDGCSLALSDLREAPRAAGSAWNHADATSRMAALLADLHAHLDPRQSLVAIGRASPRLSSLAAEMRSSPGRRWTEFIEGAGENPAATSNPLDGPEVGITGDTGRWRAKLIARPGPAGEVTGYDLYLIPAEITELPEPSPQSAPAPMLRGILRADLAPLLRRPINRIVANAETIRTRLLGPLEEEYAAYAGDIAGAALHLLTLVEDLAELESIEAPGFAPRSERFDLADAARKAGGMLSIRARERGISLELPEPDVTAPALGEFGRVLQVLLNLVGNAIRYAPARSTIRLIAANEGPIASLTVADEGEGLSAEQQARVFAKFERLGRRGGGGSGLGLYISRRLARAMGGDVTVASKPGEGARFIVTLPALG